MNSDNPGSSKYPEATDSPIDPFILENSPHLEIKQKIDFWHARLLNQLLKFNSYADYWRLIKPARVGDLSGFANPQVTETTRATEAIATFLFRAMTSAQPNFQLLSNNPNVDPESLWVSEQVINWQLQATNYRRKLLKACRSVALFGTVGVEEPWVTMPGYYESTDFVPRALLQMAFDPLTFDIGLSSWHAVIDYMTEDQLRALAKAMPQVYDAQAIEDAITSSRDTKNLSPELIARMAAAGYYTYQGGTTSAVSHIYQFVTYYGGFTDDATRSEWVISTINDLKTVRGHTLSQKRRPFVFGHLNEFEMEPYSYGVGRVAEMTQPEMNSNRGRMHDTITFSLFNQWLVSRLANIKSKQLVVKPWGVVEVDGNVEEAIKAIRPQLEGVNFGLQLEALMKNEFRATTGATDNLQALVTEATATESSIAQTEAVRRLSVIAELVSEPLLREHISKMHENNLTFLDSPFNVAVTGEDNPLRVFPNSLAQDVSVSTKIVTDKDFRPQRNKDLLQFLQVVTSIRSQNPQLGMVDLQPFVEEFARGIGMNPKKVWSQMAPQVAPMMAGVPGQAPPGMPSAMDRIAQMKQGMDTVRETAGKLGAGAHSDAMALAAGGAQ
jgi:hypothetical protein